jgi:hypothetical protein
MLKIISAIGTALLLAGCQTTSPRVGTLSPGQFEEPAKPGETKIRLIGIDLEKWSGRADSNAASLRSRYDCKPLACPSPAWVIYARRPSTTRKPDQIALEKLVTQWQSEMTSSGDLNVKGHVKKSKGYPAIVMEYNKEVQGKTYHVVATYIFAGSIRVTMAATSEDMQSARKYRDEFISKLEIKDGGSAAQ